MSKAVNPRVDRSDRRYVSTGVKGFIQPLDGRRWWNAVTGRLAPSMYLNGGVYHVGISVTRGGEYVRGLE